MSLKAEVGVAHLPSRRLRPTLKTNDKSFWKFISELSEQVQGSRKRKLTAAQIYDYQHHLTCIILNCFTAGETNSDLWVGYSRGKQNFTSGGAYWSDERNAPILSKSYLLPAIKFLAEHGLLENVIAKAGFGKFSSRFRAAPPLKDILREMGFSWAMVADELDTDLLIVKDENKKKMPWPDPGSFDVRQALAQLNRINENLQSTLINLNVSDEVLEELTNIDASEEDEDLENEEKLRGVDFTNRKLRRIFGLGSFQNGGRFYGGWWQHVPSHLTCPPGLPHS